MKKLLSAMMMIAMLMFTACSKDTIDDPNGGGNTITQVDEVQKKATETVQQASSKGLMVQSVSQAGNDYTVTFSDGTSVLISLKNSSTGSTAYVRSVNVGEENVIFSLTNGQTITLPLLYAMTVTFDGDDLMVMGSNETRDVHYTVKSNVDDITVKLTPSQGVQAEVIAGSSSKEGVVRITTGNTVPDGSNVVVFVSNAGNTVSYKISIEAPGLKIYNNNLKEVPASGGEVKLEFLTNIDCSVIIPEEFDDWISSPGNSRALEYAYLVVNVAPNNGYTREGKVTVRGANDEMTIDYVIKQTGELGDEVPDLENDEVPANEIWYVTSKGSKIDFSSSSFDATISSNEYSNGYGVVRFNDPVTKIGDYACYNMSDLVAIYLPDGVKEIGVSAFYGTSLQTLRIPASIETVGQAALDIPALTAFSGAGVDESGRCVVVNNTLVGIATKGAKEIVIPGNARNIQMSLSSGRGDVESLLMAEGVETFEDGAFYSWTALKTVTFPNSLKSAFPYAFWGCPALEGFYGNPNFVSSDNRGFVVDNGGPILCKAAIADLDSYTIPDDVVGIENYALGGYPNLKSVTLNPNIYYVGSSAFDGDDNLEAVYGPNTTDDHLAIATDGELALMVVKSKCPADYKLPNNITSIAYGAFKDCTSLKSVTMGDQLTTIGDYAFDGCTNLETITLSAGLKTFGPIYGANPLRNCRSLTAIYCRAQVPPRYAGNDKQSYRGCTLYVPTKALDLYKASEWSMYGTVEGYNYDDLPDDNTYFSTDFSADGTITMLQQASEGHGIDIVLMGDGFSDRQIAAGVYTNAMNSLYESLFDVEPYASFKNLFNVYVVTVVSLTEGVDNGPTALNSYFGSGTVVGGDDETVFRYAYNLLGNDRMNETLFVVAVNKDTYAGTCYMYYSTSMTSNWSSGPAVAYFPLNSNETTLHALIHHEALGHGFAKLDDEYYYEYMGNVPANSVKDTKQRQTDWGWSQNIDFTDNLNKVLWSEFIADSRYASEKLGAYEGGMTYPYGVWRPTENSIMLGNLGEFNAPSRRAIYYRIHKLAYGADWQYDYEDFVKYDMSVRSAANSRASKPTTVIPVDKHTAPIVVEKTWKDALGK